MECQALPGVPVRASSVPWGSTNGRVPQLATSAGGTIPNTPWPRAQCAAPWPTPSDRGICPCATGFPGYCPSSPVLETPGALKCPNDFLTCQDRLGVSRAGPCLLEGAGGSMLCLPCVTSPTSLSRGQWVPYQLRSVGGGGARRGGSSGG